MKFWWSLRDNKKAQEAENVKWYPVFKRSLAHKTYSYSPLGGYETHQHPESWTAIETTMRFVMLDGVKTYECRDKAGGEIRWHSEGNLKFPETTHKPGDWVQIRKAGKCLWLPDDPRDSPLYSG